MKKITRVLMCVMFLMVALSSTVFAQDIKVLLNGKAIAFDQPPVLKNGRTLVPLRGIFEALGATNIYWNDQTNEVIARLGNKSILLTIGSRKAALGIDLIMLDQAPETINGRTLVPVRFISEASGAKVKWDPATSTINITNIAVEEYANQGKIEGWVNTKGAGSDTRNAGVFPVSDDKLPVLKKVDVSNMNDEQRSAVYRANLGKINGVISNYCFVWYVPYMTQGNTVDVNMATFKHDNKTNRYGVEIQGWRKSYNSDLPTNLGLNAVLTTFYFLSGDKEVAYALWSWIDAASIYGYSNSDYFGFKDITWNEKGGIIKMNNTEIEVILTNGTISTLYFN